MPIADNANYEPGHFDRVYEYLIKPSVEQAGFKPVRGDDIKKTNYIIIDIIKRLIDSDMALCDLSSKNPNVLYELGIRQAFNRPVTFIKDNITDRLFDIQGFRDFEYDSSLRIDTVEKERIKLSEIVQNTFNNESEDVNSIIDLLSINKATINKDINITPELSVILSSIENLSNRITSIQENNQVIDDKSINLDSLGIERVDFDTLNINDTVFHRKFGVGKIIELEGKAPNQKVRVNFKNHGEKYLLFRFAGLGKINNNEA